HGWLQHIRFIEVVKNVRYPFLERAKWWIRGSVALMILGVVMFATTGDRKYGLDFTGGTTARMRFASNTTSDEVRHGIASILTPVDPGKSETAPEESGLTAARYTIEVARQDVAAGSAVTDLKSVFAGRLAQDRPFENVNYLGPNVVANLKESAIVSIIFSIGAI